jgi:hypothetical protein
MQRKMDMTQDSSSLPLTVTVTGGLVRIESGMPSLPIFRSTLELPGGTATFDIQHPVEAPASSIDDHVAAETWIGELYGPAALNHVSGIGLDEEPDEQSARMAYEPTETAGNLRRLALGQWLWRYWPVSKDVRPLDPTLLRFELAALAWNADECFLSLQPAANYLAGQLEKLCDAAAALVKEPVSEQDSDLGRAILGALDAAVVGPSGTVATQDDALLDRLDDLLSRLVARVDGREPTADLESGVESLEQWLHTRSEAIAELVGALPERSERSALVAGGQGDTEGIPGDGGVDTVDWIQVPARVLDWNEGNVSWSAEPIGNPGTWQVSIMVDAVPLGEDAEQPTLFARGYLPDGTPAGDLPVLVVPLSRLGNLYVASATLTTDQPGKLRIDVYSAASVVRPIVGDAARASWADQREQARWQIRERSRGRGYDPNGSDRLFVGETND